MQIRNIEYENKRLLSDCVALQRRIYIENIHLQWKIEILGLVAKLKIFLKTMYEWL